MIKYRLRTSFKDGKYQHRLEVSTSSATDTSFFDSAKKVKDTWLTPSSKKINEPLQQCAKLNEEIINKGKYKTIEVKLEL